MNLSEWLLELSALLFVAVLLAVFAKRVRLPLTVVLAGVGFGAGALDLVPQNPLQGETFEEVVVFLFLPVLVFEAALGLSLRALFRNLVPILVLAVPALLVSAALVGVTLYYGLGLPLAAALVFGVLISATDPVAVVAVFRELGVPKRLLTLVEGESLLNDGVAIVLFSVLLALALGERTTVSEGLLTFIRVFFGGVALGVVLGFVASLLLPYLERLPAAALSLALAYGGFVLAEHVLGVSGVVTVVAAGLVLAGNAPSRASREVREMWESLWEALSYIANALLFLFIGLAISLELLIENAGAIGLAILAVLVARALAVVPFVWGLERLAGIPPVGRRNEAVLVWGGLRGGVALALALALPDSLPQRELFVAMTGGVVLTTLLLNATTMSGLIHRLGLDEPTRADEFLTESARLAGVATARNWLSELGLENPELSKHLDKAEHSARTSLAAIGLSDAEELEVVARRGLAVEHETYQHLSDAGLLPPSVANSLLREVGEGVEEVALGETELSRLRGGTPHPLVSWLERLSEFLPKPVGEDAAALAYAEASARRLAARRSAEALDFFERLPNVSRAAVERAKNTFRSWEEGASERVQKMSREHHELQRHQAEALCRVTAEDALGELVEVGLLPKRIAHHAAQEVATDLDEDTDTQTFGQKVVDAPDRSRDRPVEDVE